MSKLHTIPLLLVVTLLLSGTAPRQSDVIIEAREPGQQEMAEWAVARYAEAGLDLPRLVVQFSGRDLSNCGGAPGRVYLDRDPIEVRMCWNSEFVLLHELAHAWEAHNVAADKHEPFMAMRDGVVSWAGLDAGWEERGREHAANVIAWGLLEDPYPISTTYPNDVASMIEAFVFLTGGDPLHDGGSGIQHPDRSLFDERSNPPLESGR
jgi:hypothetical protein